jgi:superfamily I DNA/RNA helicase
LEWVKDPENTFLTRLAIESLINHGLAKVPGAGKGKRCKPETLAKRVRIETEIAELWEDVDRKRSMMIALRDHSSPSAAMQLVRNTLNELLGAFLDSNGEQSGEFAKQLSLASGAWTDPAKMVNDLCSISDLLSTGQPTSFGAVQLMTMRKAKGLEADVVVIVGLEDDVIHNPTSSLDEEARLFYVSMTRAKEKLYLIHSYKRLRSISFGPEVTGKQRSRFLDAIGRPSKYMKAKAKTS